MPSDLCFYVGCKKEWLPKQQAILRVLGPDEYRPGWFYMMCPNCGIRGPVYEKQADAMTEWAAMWATKAPVPESQGVRERKVQQWWVPPLQRWTTRENCPNPDQATCMVTWADYQDALQSPEPPQGEAGA